MQAIPVAEAAHVASLRAMTKPKLQEPTTHASYDAKLPPRITHVAHMADVSVMVASPPLNCIECGQLAFGDQGVVTVNELSGLDYVFRSSTPYERVTRICFECLTGGGVSKVSYCKGSSLIGVGK